MLALGLYDRPQYGGDVLARGRHAGHGAHVLRAGDQRRGEDVADQRRQQQTPCPGPCVVRFFGDDEGGHHQAVRRHPLVASHEIERIVAVGVIRSGREHEDLVAHRGPMVGERLEVFALGIEEHRRALPEIAVRKDEAGALSRARRTHDQDVRGLVGADRGSAERPQDYPVLCGQPLLGCFHHSAEPGLAIRHLAPIDECEEHAGEP